MSSSQYSGGGGNDDKPPASAQVIESGRLKVTCSTNSTGKATIKFTKSFTSRPNIVCSIWQPSAQDFVKDKYMPVVTAASATEFTVQMLSLGATINGTIWVQWIAVS
jgi:hypothetical protein